MDGVSSASVEGLKILKWPPSVPVPNSDNLKQPHRGYSEIDLDSLYRQSFQSQQQGQLSQLGRSMSQHETMHAFQTTTTPEDQHFYFDANPSEVSSFVLQQPVYQHRDLDNYSLTTSAQTNPFLSPTTPTHHNVGQFGPLSQYIAQDITNLSNTSLDLSLEPSEERSLFTATPFSSATSAATNTSLFPLDNQGGSFDASLLMSSVDRNGSLTNGGIPLSIGPSSVSRDAKMIQPSGSQIDIRISKSLSSPISISQLGSNDVVDKDHLKELFATTSSVEKGGVDEEQKIDSLQLATNSGNSFSATNYPTTLPNKMKTSGKEDESGSNNEENKSVPIKVSVREHATDASTTTPSSTNTKRNFSFFMRPKPAVADLIQLDSGRTASNSGGQGITTEVSAGGESRFLGEGQIFKGKLIGVLEVQEPRGDRMCQDALQELKTAIKASGEHKQRVVIHVAVDGLKIRDEKNGDCLFHHPVHKISFIAQDVSDNRAFGYIYGSPENGHRFFGIKTEKAAGQVVVAMRDLFQVVFELKKKEIEDAKTQLENKEHCRKEVLLLPPHHPSSQHGGGATLSAATFPLGPLPPQQHSAPHASGSALVSDLLGLENELTSLQAGIRQIELVNSIPSVKMIQHGGIPVGIQNLHGQQQQVVTTVSQSQVHPTRQQHYPQAIMNSGQGFSAKQDLFGAIPFLPPPPSKGVTLRQQQTFNKSTHSTADNPPLSVASTTSTAILSGVSKSEHYNLADKYAPLATIDMTGSIPGNTQEVFDINQQHNSVVITASNNNNNIVQTGSTGSKGITEEQQQNLQSEIKGVAQELNGQGQHRDKLSLYQQPPTCYQSTDQPQTTHEGLFTDLDPLGTGKSKPFVDRKDFFNQMKIVTSTEMVGNTTLTGSINLGTEALSTSVKRS